MQIKIADIIYETTSDMPGFSTSIYCQGCGHHCKNCHNPQTWDFDDGKYYSVEELFDIIVNEPFSDVTFTGGDPMFQVEACMELAKFAKEKKLSVWCYTGFTFEELLEMSKNNKKIIEFLNYIDVLIDGKFVLEKKSLDVKFRGSTNQRIIDVKRSLEEEKTILLDKYNENKKEFNTKPKYMFV